MDNIVEIDGEDLISESMHKINQNFHTLSQMNEQSEYGWGKYVEDIKNEIKTLKRSIDDKNIEISRQIELVDNKFGNLPNTNNIQQEIANSLSNTSSILGNAIKSLAGQQIGAMMGDYAKTSDLSRDYVTSNAFELYQSNVENKQASANTIVANSKFYTKYNNVKGSECLVLLDGTVSNYTTVKDFYFNGLTNIEKAQIDPNNKGLSDSDVLNAFIALCETRFKTVSTEMVGISSEVADGIASMDIITQIQGDDGVDKVSAIFTEANNNGSTIKLNADCLNLTGETLVVDTSNFKVNKNGDGKVVIKGEIEATKLTIAESATSDFSNLVQSAGNGVWAQVSSLSDYVQNTVFNSTLSNYATKSEVSAAEYNDGWLTGAFNKTLIEGGLALTGNIFVADSNSNITAGMMGANSSDSDDNDLRFFAGNTIDNESNIPFRVYKDGTLYATNAHITGTIEATSLIISDTATSDFSSLVQSAGNGVWAPTSALSNYVTNSSLSSTLNNYVQTTALNGYTTTSALSSALSNYPTNSELSTTLSNYATKSDLSNIQTYDDSWVSKAFNKTLIQGGLAMTGNIFAADNNGNITAGMMGATTSGNDLRFFAGSDNTNASTAPFRIYENGALYASDAHITGLLSNKFLRITSSNWETYKHKLGEINGDSYYTIDLNLTGTNVEIAYLPPIPSSVILVYEVNTPSIDENMVGSELNIINLIPKKTIKIGRNFTEYIDNEPVETNGAIIHKSNNTDGWAGGSNSGDVAFLECMRLRAIEVPGYSGSGTRYAWIRLDKYITS